MQIMIFVCHFNLNNRICGLVTKKNTRCWYIQFSNHLNFQQNVSAKILYQNLLQHLMYHIILNQNWSKLLQVKSATKPKNLKTSNLWHRLGIFSFRGKFMFHSQDSVFKTIQWFAKSVTSWWVLVHETGCIFEYIFWNTTHKITKLDQLLDISKDNNFQESFE